MCWFSEEYLRGAASVEAIEARAHTHPRLSHSSPRGEQFGVCVCVCWLVGRRGGLNLRTAIPKGALVAEKMVTARLWGG